MLEFESLLIFSLLDSLEKGIFNERISLQHETFLPLQRWVENVNFCKLIFASFNFSVAQKGETLHKSHFLDSFCASTVVVMTEKERDESGRSQLSRNRKDIKVKHQRNEFACSSHPPTLTECSPSPFASPSNRTHIRHEKREGETAERKMGMKWEKITPFRAGWLDRVEINLRLSSFSLSVSGSFRCWLFCVVFEFVLLPKRASPFRSISNCGIAFNKVLFLSFRQRDILDKHWGHF